MAWAMCSKCPCSNATSLQATMQSLQNVREFGDPPAGIRDAFDAPLQALRVILGKVTLYLKRICRLSSPNASCQSPLAALSTAASPALNTEAHTL